MEADLVGWLQGVVGKGLTSVRASIHVYEGVGDYDNPQELEIQFSSGGRRKFRCSNDGVSIDSDPTELVDCDMAEYGKQVIEDLSDSPIWKDVISRALVGAVLIRSSVASSVVGVQFRFEGGLAVSVLNLGDELYIFQEIPSQLISDQEIEFFPVLLDSAS